MFQNPCSRIHAIHGVMRLDLRLVRYLCAVAAARPEVTGGNWKFASIIGVPFTSNLFACIGEDANERQ